MQQFLKIWSILVDERAIGGGFTYPTLPITEHDIQFGIAISRYLCVFKKTILQITTKFFLSLVLSNPNHFPLQQKWQMNGFEPTLFIFRLNCVIFCMFLRHLNSRRYRLINKFMLSCSATEIYWINTGKILKLIPRPF